jgi:hypothetical protein
MAAEGSSRCPGSPIPIRGLDGATSVDVHALLSSADASDQCTALEHALRFLDDPQREALAPRAVILVFGDDPDVTSTALALLRSLGAAALEQRALWDAVRHPVRPSRHANAVTIMQEYAEYAQIWAYSTLKRHNFCSVEYFPVIVSDY